MRKATSVAKNAAAAAAATAETSTSAPQYVDRAAARREAFNQPDHPKHQQKKRKFEGPAPPAPAPVEPNRASVAIEESNVGSKMLEKMVSRW